MAHVSFRETARQLQRMGFSAPGAQQLLSGHIVSSVLDRRRLALFLAGLVQVRAVGPIGSGGRTAIQTQSGMVIEFQDNGTGHTPKSAPSRSPEGKTFTTTQTRSGIVIGFEDSEP